MLIVPLRKCSPTHLLSPNQQCRSTNGFASSIIITIIIFGVLFVITVDNEGALQEVRPRAVKGVGFGNIFSGGQINLRKPTVDKKSTSEANQPVPEPIKPSQVC